MTILVGTASWADKSVDSGMFYPPDVTSPEERLRYYAPQPETCSRRCPVRDARQR